MSYKSFLFILYFLCCNIIAFSANVGDEAPKIELIKVLNCKSIISNERYLYVGLDSNNSREIVQTLTIEDIIETANDINEEQSKKNNTEPIEYEYSALIFWATWSPSCRQVFPILQNLYSLYKDDLLFLLISRENIDQLQKFNKIAKLKFPIIIDDQSRTTLDYMSYDQNYPTVFLIDDDNEIMWRGNLVDFASVIKKLKTGDFDQNKEKKLAEYQQRLRENIRKGDLNGILALSQSILEIDNNNKVACRAILYAFNLIIDKQTAIDFVQKLVKQHPKSTALQLLFVDISIKKGFNKEQLNSLVNKIIKDFPHSYTLHNDLFWLIFNDYGFGNKPLDTLFNVNKIAYDNINKIKSKQLKANIFAARARVYYLIGNIEKALTLQKEATKLYLTPSLKKQSQNLEIYYLKAKEIGSKIN